MFVRRLIIKFYILLVLSVAILGLAIDYFLQQETLSETQKTNQKYYQSSLLFIETLLQTNNRADWEKSIQKAEKELSMAIEILSSEDIHFDSDTALQLAQNKLVVLAEEKQDRLLKKIVDSDQYIQLIIPIKKNNKSAWVMAFYLLLVAPVTIWFWPLAQDLKQLEKATKQIAENNFDYRIDLHANSNILSVSQTFNLMAERIKYLITEQKLLTSAVSHEIRTPLARLKFALELQKKSSLDGAHLEQINAMQKDVQELSELAAEMLSYAKLDNLNSPLELQMVAAENWLSNVIDDCQQSNQQIEIAYKCQLKSIQIDPHQMARAISNLIYNGLRFAKSKIFIQVNRTLSGINKTGFNIIVSDDGPGIPVEQRQRLFEPFAKIDQSRNKNALGHGLGLAIVKKIVEKHQGRIVITDSTLGGAQFEMTFEQPEIG